MTDETTPVEETTTEAAPEMETAAPEAAPAE